jgi:hypothetical protein
MSKKSKEIISKAFSHSIALSLFDSNETIPENLLNHYSKKINPNAIPDKELIKKESIHENVNWDIIEKNKAIRILSRDIELIKKIKINLERFSPTDLYPIFLQHPELITQIITDLSKLTPLEAIKILECNQDLIEEIDISKYKFSKRDFQEIIKKFRRSERIMERLDLTKLDHFETRKLICKTGVDYIDRLNLDSLKNTDWLEILEQHPDLIEFCNLSKFETNDCYLLVKLVIKFPELEYLIEKNKDKISALGWETLIKEDLDRYQDICPWDKFSESNWLKILRKHPHLSTLKQQYYLF